MKKIKLSESNLKEILRNFNLGTLKSFDYLTNGFHSTNIKLSTSKGSYILKIFHEDLKTVRYILNILEFLTKKRIKTSKVYLTRDNKNHLIIKDLPTAILNEISGSILPINKFTIKKYAKEFAKMEKTLSKLKLKGREDVPYAPELLNYYFNESKCKDLKIIEQYNKLKKELKDIPLNKLKKCIINSDCGKEDMLWKNEKFQGFLDFGDSHNDYLLYDLASTIMYLSLWKKHNLLGDFMKEYQKTMQLNKIELDSLYYFVKLRALIQATYFSLRIKKRCGTLNENNKVFIN
jgi:homoserine kinase type II